MNTRNPGNQERANPIEERLLAQALAAVSEPVFIADHLGRIVWTNHALNERSGFSPQEYAGQTPSFLKSGDRNAPTHKEIWQTITAGQTWSGEVLEQCKDGSLYAANEVITPLRNDKGTVTHFVAVQQVTVLHGKKAETEQTVAYQDTLTGLYNEGQFLDLVKQAIARSEGSTRPLALLVLDVDDFKHVNNTYGQEAGDRVLMAIGGRLGTAVRKFTDAAARLNGNQFAVLQTDITNSQSALSLANNLLQTISRPFGLDGVKIQIGVSIGIAIYPGDGRQAEELLKSAVKAKDLAKALGGGKCQFHDAGLRQT
jgi:diguanylate cyclase